MSPTQTLKSLCPEVSLAYDVTTSIWSRDLSPGAANLKVVVKWFGQSDVDLYRRLACVWQLRCEGFGDLISRAFGWIKV